MIGAASVRGERAPEIRRREGRHLLVDAKLLQRAREFRQALRDNCQHARLIFDHLVMMIPATEHQEEGLSAGTEGLARTDDAGDLGKRRRNPIRGKTRHERRRASQRGTEAGLCIYGAAQLLRIARPQEVVVVAAQNPIERSRLKSVKGIARAVTRNARRALGARFDRILCRLKPGLEHIRSGQRDIHRHAGPRIQTTEQVRCPAAPAGGNAGVRHARLPVCDLIRVREESERHGNASLELGCIEWTDQSAQVRNEGQLARVVQGTHFGHGRMHCERPPNRIRARKRQQTRSRQGEIRT